MRVGILTFHFAVNYGAVIQAWALAKWLESRGHEACIVNYVPYARGAHRIMSQIKKGFRNLLAIIRFGSFIRRNLTLSGKVRCLEDLERLTFDAIIVGSDQVWNVNYFTSPDGRYNPFYFLKRDGIKGRKIAYAASIGDGLWSRYPWVLDLTKDIKGFDAISVRENYAQSELAELGVESRVVPDPTFLIDREYYKSEMIRRVRSQKYVLAYLLSEKEQGFAILEFLAKKTDSEIRKVMLSDFAHSTEIPSPIQWVELIASASYVVTDSFHGTALSIIMNVPFLVVLKPERAGMNSRIVEMLDRFGLRDRIIKHEADVDKIFGKAIDWSVVNLAIARCREEGVKFLEGALHG